MQLIQSPSGADQNPTLYTVGSGDRARLSGPGLRTFRGIADLWSLPEVNRIAVLGSPARSTYHSWMQKAANHAPVTLPHDTLVRISAVLGIYKSLSILFVDDTQAVRWLKGAHQGTVFSGSAPLSFIVEDGIDGMMTVRRYLDAWRGGHVGHGAPEGSFEPVTEKDLVFI